MPRRGVCVNMGKQYILLFSEIYDSNERESGCEAGAYFM